jgi:glucose 1-dehydrogenase
MRALVTGAARGIGQAIAIELAKRGADIAIADTADADQTIAAVESQNVRGLYQQTDVSGRPAMESLFDRIQNEFGGLDILINNAARSIRKPLIDLSVEDVEATWSVALWGVFHATQLAARMMIAQKQPGNIVTISSVLAHVPYVNSSPYNGAKAAINQMTRTWALELAPHGIRVNAIEPGWIDTPGERAFASEDQLREEAAKLPLGRLGRAEEIAKAVAFLVSEDASYITGSILQVDGGISLIR